MTTPGKLIRMERIMNRHTGRTVILPLDHGVSFGPIPGAIDLRQAIEQAAEGGANAIVQHKGAIKAEHLRQGRDMGLIVHLSASTHLGLYPHAKTLVCSVEEALKLGADAVSIQVNLGNGHEARMLKDFGEVSRKANEWGIPLMAMIYPRGETIRDEYGVDVVKHAARIGAELGADLVKVSYTGSAETFREVVAGCWAPVVIAGGEKMDSDRAVLEMVKGAVDAGAAGASIGRNVFQHRHPGRMLKAICAVVHEGSSLDAALAYVQ